MTGVIIRSEANNNDGSQGVYCQHKINFLLVFGFKVHTLRGWEQSRVSLNSMFVIQILPSTEHGKLSNELEWTDEIKKTLQILYFKSC